MRDLDIAVSKTFEQGLQGPEAERVFSPAELASQITEGALRQHLSGEDRQSLGITKQQALYVGAIIQVVVHDVLERIQSGGIELPGLRAVGTVIDLTSPTEHEVVEDDHVRGEN